VIAQRLAAARDEMSHYDEFDFVVVNDDFEAAVAETCSIFVASRLRRERQVERHADLISALLVEGGGLTGHEGFGSRN
jgi:guanylate kinase